MGMCFDPLNEVYMLPLLEEALLEKQLSLPVASRKSPFFHLGHSCVALTHPDVSHFVPLVTPHATSWAFASGHLEIRMRHMLWKY